MREDFFDNVGPVWTPQVWRDGPDRLVAEATAEMWGDQRDIQRTLDTPAIDAMSGNHTAPQNESDQLISTLPTDRGTVREEWDTTLKDLRQTEPLAAGAIGDLDRGVNPAP